NVTQYETDYALWCAEQGTLLRAGRLDALDRENLAEEIESLARSDKKEIRKRLEVLLRHLIKWEFQPNKRKRGWYASIAEQRRQLGYTLDESPSLKNFPSQVLDSMYELARLKAGAETSLPESRLPQRSPYKIEEVLDEAFLPGEPW